MSLINTTRDLESLCVDIRTGDLSAVDISLIAAAIPDELLAQAFLRRFAKTGRAPKRALDPQQKYELTARLLAAWLALPLQRLGQLIYNSHTRLESDLYYVEDSAFIDMIETFRKGYTPTE